MKIIECEQNTEAWLELRKSKITGSKLKDVIAKRGGRKLGFYQLIADKLSLVDEVIEDPRERGHRLEEEGLELLENEIGLEIDKNCGFWVSDENGSMAYSADGGVKIDGVYRITCEMKAPGAARHIKIIVENAIPDEYWEQMLQSFIVNTDQETHYFASYNPNVIAKPLHVIRTERDTVAEEVERYKQYQLDTLAEIDAIVEELAF